MEEALSWWRAEQGRNEVCSGPQAPQPSMAPCTQEGLNIC